MKWNQKKINIALGCVLFLEILLIFILNMVKGSYIVDNDVAKLYVHIIEMWKRRQVLIDGWRYITTLELDCSAFLALPLYAITKNIYIAVSVMNVIICGIYIWVVFQIFDERYERSYPLLCLILIFIPYRTGQLDYFNMMFFNGGQYAVKVLIPLILVALFSQMEREQQKKKRIYILLALYVVLLLLTSFSSGIYVFACGICGIFMFNGLIAILNHRRAPKGYVTLLIISVCCVSVGLAAQHFGGYTTKGSGMTLCHILGQLQDNMWACVLGIFELFGGAAYVEKEVVSPEGIEICFRVGFVIALLISAVYTAVRVYAQKENIQMTSLLAVFVWNFAILLVCNTRYSQATYEYRYHIIGAVPLLCLLAVNLLKWFSSCRTEMEKTVSILCGLCLILLMLGYSVRNIMNYRPPFDLEAYKGVCGYAIETQTERVYFANDDSGSAELCRLIDPYHSVYLNLGGMDNLIEAYDYYDFYNGQSFEFQNAIFVYNYENDETEKENLIGIFGSGCKDYSTFGEYICFRY